MNKNMISSSNNSLPYDNNTNNRRVQFSMYAKNNNATSTTSIKSIPNVNPLTAQESMPYRPELDEYSNSNQSPPKLTHDIKSIEINNSKNVKNTYNSNTINTHHNNNNSTPESILNEPIPSNHHEYDSKSFINNNFLTNSNSCLVNQESRQVSDDSDEKSMNNNNNKLPLTNYNNIQLKHNNNHSTNNTQNSSEFDIFRQDTMPAHGTYPSDIRPAQTLPGLYSQKSQPTTESAPPLPNATSIALNPSNTNNNMLGDTMGDVGFLQFNQSVPTTTMTNNNVNSKRRLSLNKDFENNKQAFDTWMACCDIQDHTFGYYSALYPLLCEIFAENTKCLRVPKQSDLEEVILKHGAKKLRVNKFHGMDHLSHLSGTISSDIVNDVNNKKGNRHSHTQNRNISTTISFDFDNPNIKPKYLVTIKYKCFYKFWKWFEECCKIIKELSHLWDANNQSALQCNLFCAREESQQILQQAPQGTFMLRLSSIIKGGIVLTYREPSFNKNNRTFKHIILMRRNVNQYELKSSNKKHKNNNKNNSKHKTTSIDSLIRSFVKIKFLYTPHNLYPKKSIF